MLEGLNEEIKRRTLVVRIFPNLAACLRLVRAHAVEMHEDWIEATRYLNIEYLKEHKKEHAVRSSSSASSSVGSMRSGKAMAWTGLRMR